MLRRPHTFGYAVYVDWALLHAGEYTFITEEGVESNALSAETEIESMQLYHLLRRMSS